MARGLKKIIRTDVPDYADSDVVPLNPEDTAPQSVGELLRTKREEFGVDLREAADYLNIRYAYLLAIEEGRVDDLPGAAYAMGFVRAYADYLGLDGPAIVERYKDETAELGDDVRLVFPSPLPEGKVPSGAIILIGLLALVLVYGGWVILAQQNVKIAELVPALPEQFSALLGSDEGAEATPEPAPIAAEPATPALAQASAAEPKVTAPQEAESKPQIAETTPVVAPVTEAPAVVTTDPGNTAPVAEAESAGPSEVQRELQAAGETVEASAVSPEPASPGETTVVQSAEIAESRVAAAASVNGSVAVNGEETAQSVATDAQTEAPASPTSPDEAPPQSTNVPQDTETPTSTSLAQTPPAATPVDQVDTPTTPAAVQTEGRALPLPPKPPALASAEPRQFGSDNAGSRIVITARIDSWVQIRDQDGEKLLTRVLRAGDSYRVPDRPGLLMETGNAGGLEITVDSETIPDLGPKGAVRRGIALDADSLKSGGSR